MPIQGTSGNDQTLQGSTGDDLVLLYGGNDFFVGGEGNDSIYAGAGNDTIGFDVGDDVIFGGGGNDSLGPYFYQSGNASIYGGDDNDTIRGSAGDDLLVGDNGTDDLQGGSGNDIYVVTKGFDTITENLGGDDPILMSQTLSTAAREIYRIGSDLFIDIFGGPVAAVAGHFNPFGLGKTEVETLEFLDGVEIDLLARGYTTYGFSTKDFINGVTVGGLADDTIHAYGGGDVIDGGKGIDVVFAGSGRDNVQDSGDDGPEGLDGGDYLYGGANNDTLDGGWGSDWLDGGTGNDRLIGGPGDDTFVVTTGRDTLVGDGDGADVILFEDSTALVTFTAYRSGNNLHLGTLSGKELVIEGQFNGSNNGWGVIETLQFADGDSFDLTAASYVTYGTSKADGISGIRLGGQPNDTIYAGAGKDVVYGGDNAATDGADVIYGGDNDDSIYGGVGNFNDALSGDAGRDSLYGGFGDDTLAGGSASNKLYGGYGNDVYLMGPGLDLISDDRGADQLQFLDATTLDDLGFSRFRLDLIITVNGVGAATVKNQFYGLFPGDYAVETVAFADGTTFDLTSLLL